MSWDWCSVFRMAPNLRTARPLLPLNYGMYRTNPPPTDLTQQHKWWHTRTLGDFAGRRVWLEKVKVTRSGHGTEDSNYYGHDVWEVTENRGDRIYYHLFRAPSRRTARARLVRAAPGVVILKS